MKKILILTSSLCAFICADEFVEYGPSIGGYGELHYNMEGESMDFHRYIFYVDNVFDDKWSFKSEVEIEHNMVGSGNDGYMAIEQAYLNYNGGTWGFRGGVVLTPAGITNEYHEPPTFLSVERPEYNKYIIPTTWFGNGFQFYGSTGDLSWKFNLSEDLLGSGVGEGFRSARAKGEDSYTTDWTKTIQLSWTGMEGFKVGGSVTMNDAPLFDDDDNVSGTVGINLTELNATYTNNNIYARMEYGTVNYTDNFLDDSGDNPIQVGAAGADGQDVYEVESSSGYYLDLGYDVSSMLGCDGKLMTWMRTSSYSKNDDNDAKDISLFGVTYWPNNNVSIKFETGESGDSDVMRMGLGYMF